MGEKREKKNVSRNTRILRAKKMENNLLEKVRKQVFYKHTNVVTIKWEKTREKILPETHVYRELKTMEKNRLEKVRNKFFINTRIS